MIELIAVGKLKDKALESLQATYLKRIGYFTKMHITEVKDEPNERMEVEKILHIEGQRVLEKIKEEDFVVLLDLHGQMMTSEHFASQLDHWQQKPRLVFVIGGSLGVDQALVQRANVRWSLSQCTLPHQLCRIVVCEQIFRGYSINHHRPYHK